MDNRATNPLTLVLGTTVVLLGVLAAYALGSGRSGPAAQAAEPSAPQTRTILMEGVGEVTAVPDNLAFDVAVSAKAPSVASALAQGNVTLHRVLVALAKLGVTGKDVQTTGLSIDPEYHYYNYAPPVIDGYRATERIEVVARSLGAGGKAISAAANAGGNRVRISDVRLKLGKQTELLRQARDEAVAEAKDKAEQYAEASGASLGSVMSLREVRASAPEPQQLYLSRAAVADVAGTNAVPLRAGSEQLRVTVAVVWSLD